MLFIDVFGAEKKGLFHFAIANQRSFLIAIWDKKMNEIIAILAAIATLLGISQVTCQSMRDQEKVGWCYAQFKEYYLVQACLKDPLWDK